MTGTFLCLYKALPLRSVASLILSVVSSFFFVLPPLDMAVVAVNRKLRVLRSPPCLPASLCCLSLCLSSSLSLSLPLSH